MRRIKLWNPLSLIWRSSAQLPYYTPIVSEVYSAINRRVDRLQEFHDGWRP